MTMPEITRNSILRISDRKTIQLIQEYRKEECLWNTFLDDYPNRAKRAQAASKIAKILNIPHFEGEHVLFKFKNLRNSYCQELKKIANAEEMGETYTPKVLWFKMIDSFIRPHLQTARSSALKEVTHSEEMIFESIRTDSEPDEQQDWTVPCTIVAPIETTYKEECPSEEDDDVVYEPIEKKPKVTNETTPQDQIFEISNDSFPAPSTSHNKDCFDDFGKYIASLLRTTLPPHKALTVQAKIVSLIVKEVSNAE